MKEQCLIIAGEKSGEEHCLSFLHTLKKERPDCHFFGVGGDDLANEGMELLYHLKDFSSWGFSEVIGKIPFYFKAFNHIVSEVKKRNCKVAILIDFQDFNLRLAKKLKKEGVQVLYYVAPQAWAWKAYRAAVLEKSVHTLFTIIPFEKKWFSDRGVKRVRSVAHPLWIHYKERLQTFNRIRNFDDFKKNLRIVLLPGSRRFEVASLLPEFIKVIQELKKERQIEVAIVCSSSVSAELYGPYMDFLDKVYTNDELASALEWADCSLAASGTVTLATAMFGLPTVVCYKSSFLNEFIFHTFIDYDGPISLANIFRGKSFFPELVQESCSDFNIIHSLKKIIDTQQAYDVMKKELNEVLKSVQGDDFNVGAYMGQVIKESYNEN